MATLNGTIPVGTFDSGHMTGMPFVWSMITPFVM